MASSVPDRLANTVAGLRPVLADEIDEAGREISGIVSDRGTIRVLTVIGTRPEAIKLAPVLMAMKGDRRFESRVLVSGQHREMLGPMLAVFGIEPDVDLDTMVEGQSLTASVSTMLARIGPVLEEERPDWVLVEGDTATVMATGLAAFFNQVRVGHVEAGLRAMDVHSPFPEELDRRITSIVADMHFAPTQTAAAILRAQAIPPDKIFVTGNPVIDAARYVRTMEFDPTGTPLEHVPLEKRLILATAHRRENLGGGMEQISMGFRELVSGRDDTHIVFPVHLNPAVQHPVNRILGDAENVSLVPPLEYPALIWLLERSYFVMTDSGGIQEEAAGFSKPVLVLRDDTERYEGLESGIAKLIGPRRDAIVAEGTLLLDDNLAYARMLATGSPYGDGHAAERIVEALAGTAEKRLARPADPWASFGARLESLIAEEGEFGFPLKLVSKLAGRLTPGR